MSFEALFEKKSRFHRIGFTLIEVLIVVVIIAVLAALILPRYVNQAENAAIAEALQTLGSLRRAQQAYMDTNASATGLLFNCNTGLPAICNVSQLTSLGFQPIDQRNFTFQCAADAFGEYCVARRASGPYSTPQSYISLRYLATGATPDGTLGCGVNYTKPAGSSICRAS